MKIIGLAGWSGSGKTTLMVQLLEEISARGVRVSTMKHAHHAVDIDQPGKDSWRHRQAGASEVMLVTGNRWFLMHEKRDDPEPPIESLIARMEPVDLLIVEGFKRHPIDKVEVFRPSVGKPPIWPGDDRIVAVASDAAELPGLDRPLLDLNSPSAIVDFILTHTGLRP
ncbi:MAG: molybdopterin-guanine dinucleotide biosynthesis protein B [Rhodospirillaceae bacterium]